MTAWANRERDPRHSRRGALDAERELVRPSSWWGRGQAPDGAKGRHRDFGGAREQSNVPEQPVDGGNHNNHPASSSYGMPLIARCRRSGAFLGWRLIRDVRAACAPAGTCNMQHEQQAASSKTRETANAAGKSDR